MQGKRDDTPSILQECYSARFPSFQRQDDLRVRIEPLRNPRARGAALGSQLNLQRMPFFRLEFGAHRIRTFPHRAASRRDMKLLHPGRHVQVVEFRLYFPRRFSANRAFPFISTVKSRLAGIWSASIFSFALALGSSDLGLKSSAAGSGAAASAFGAGVPRLSAAGRLFSSFAARSFVSVAGSWERLRPASLQLRRRFEARWRRGAVLRLAPRLCGGRRRHLDCRRLLVPQHVPASRTDHDNGQCSQNEKIVRFALRRSCALRRLRRSRRSSLRYGELFR